MPIRSIPATDTRPQPSMMIPLSSTRSSTSMKLPRPRSPSRRMAQGCACSRPIFGTNDANPSRRDNRSMTIGNGAPALLAPASEDGVEKPFGHLQAEARKVVLVVEDEPAIGQLIADAISDEPGYFGIHVTESAAAIEATQHVIPDVMVVD